MTTKGFFNIDVYACGVHVIVGDNIQRSINYHLRQDGQKEIDFEPDGYFNQYVSEGRIGTYYLFFNRENLCHEIINHEKSHLVEQILKDRSISTRGEVQAYLDGCVSQKLMAFFKKRKLKIHDNR